MAQRNVKKPPLAPSRDLGRLSQAELDKLDADYHASSSLNAFEQDGGAANPDSGGASAAVLIPPHSKHGGTIGNGTEPVRLILRDGKVVFEMVRQPAAGECCIIDTLRITMDEATIHRAARATQVTDDQAALEVSKILSSIFGYGITKRYEKGRDFYSAAWEIGDNFGHFAMGGSSQRNTILLAINGRGCLAAIEGWEQRLYQFITSPACVRPTITRIDLAHDDFDGKQVTVDDYDRAWEEGGFDRYGNTPEPCQFGPWKNGDPTGKGRTFYAGTKQSSQLFRGYEKGRQLGAPESQWVRSEVQFSNHDKVIPLDILISPSDFFVAAYPVLGQFGINRTPRRTEVTKRSVEAGIEHFVRHTKRSYGKFIRLARELYGDSAALDLLQSDTDDLPDRLVWPDHRFTQKAIHELPPVNILPYLDFITAAPTFGYNGENDYSVAINRQGENHEIHH